MPRTAFWNDLALLQLGREQIENGNAIVPKDNRQIHESISQFPQDTHDDEDVDEQGSSVSGENWKRRASSLGFGLVRDGGQLWWRRGALGMH